MLQESQKACWSCGIEFPARYEKCPHCGQYRDDNIHEPGEEEKHLNGRMTHDEALDKENELNGW